MLETGITAPDFTLEDQDGNAVSLADFRGKNVILYFYPKDNTPGCTSQALLYQQLKDQIEDRDAIVLGVSKDTCASHRKFADKQGLTFTLLADPEHKVNELYDVWKEKNMYGKKVWGTVRSTYLIGKDGTILEAHGKVKPKEDPENMLKSLEALS